jgi:hypothetical protein
VVRQIQALLAAGILSKGLRDHGVLGGSLQLVTAVDRRVIGWPVICASG